jgi:hypothetical protein
MFFCGAVMATFAGRADDPSVHLEYSSRTVLTASPSRDSFSLWKRFQVDFAEGADDLFADRFHPLKVMKMSIDVGDSRPFQLRERQTMAMRRTVARSFADGMREATVELPVMQWLEERQGFIADFLKNSIGNTEEEAVAPLKPSYGVVERSWWRRMSDSGHVNYGIRPFRTDPYAFLSLAIREGQTVFLLGNLRYYYRNFADHKFELALSVPLAYGFSLDLGSSYQFGQHDDEKIVVKLSKAFENGGILHLGFEVRDHPGLFAGISLPW